jgi:hypothetical protein
MYNQTNSSPASGRHVPAQGAATKIHKPRSANIRERRLINEVLNHRRAAV